MTRAREQFPLPFGPLRNRNFLSNHWLEHRLVLEPEWDQRRAEAGRLFQELKKLWAQQAKRVEHYAEATLEQAFIQPVLASLGWTFQYQTFLRGRGPDYAFFMNENEYDAALKGGRNKADFWTHACMVGDAKAWKVNLDVPSRGLNNQREYPPEQIEWYIDHARCDYGILTNGRLWRFYPRELASHQPRFETYVEFDLQLLLETWGGAGDAKGQRTIQQDTALLDSVLKFYLFFSPVAFESIDGRKPLVQRAVEGSNEYRVGVGEGLKDRVFEALRICMEGFLWHKPNKLDAEKDLWLCKEQSLILLYRLLFIMYAEDRELLPYRSNRTYRENRSLARLRDLVSARLTSLERRSNSEFDPTAEGLWEDLGLLFDLIDRGGKRYGIPAYNGGLFDPEENAFLKDNVLPDRYLALVIDQLGRAPDVEHPDAGLFRVDYRDLSIQHLGHVYEGLLELQPRWATEPMAVIRKRGRQRTQEKVIPCSETIPTGFQYANVRYETGEVFLVTDKGERRATGSYYTPDNIVDHIISQTLSPVCSEIGSNLATEIKETEAQLKRARGRNRELLKETLQKLQNSFADRVLNLKVLDPAMGSGHFLLRACQYLAEEIATNPHTRDPDVHQLLGDQSILTLWKRRVVEHCLHGVDINPLAVELAKVALWLETAAIGQPLTFLDHHLRCGNSLVGAWLPDLGALPGMESMPLFEQQASYRLPALLEGFKMISDKPSGTRDEVKVKSEIYHQTVDKIRKPFVAVASAWCATFFLNKTQQITPDQYQEALEALGTPAKYRKLLNVEWFKYALQTARGSDIACFHWELEFPDVFFDLGGRRDEGGFDIIIGNPPYDVLSEKESGRDLTALKSFLQAQSLYRPSFRGKNNLYKLFMCLALTLLRQNGRMGFITPMAILGDDQAADLRRMMLSTGAFTSIDAFPQKDDPRRRVFPEAKLSTAVFSYQKTCSPKSEKRDFTSRVHPAQYVADDSPSLILTSAQIPLYDPTNVTIVSCSQKDWDLAVRIMQSGRMTRFGEVAKFFQGEVNETNERARGSFVENANRGKLVTRGACICLYITRPASQGTDLHLDIHRFLQGKGHDTKAYHHQHRRIGLQESCPQNNFRRIIAALIPRGEFCNHKINYLPEFACSLPLEFNLAVLNSKLSDWHFRLGSTNAAVSHYQLYNLPYPNFAEQNAQEADKLCQDATTEINARNFIEAFEVLRPTLLISPFSVAVRDTIIKLVRLIIDAEQRRGEIARSERSALCSEAQPYQDLIDRLFYAMAGLTDDESSSLEERLSMML